MLRMLTTATELLNLLRNLLHSSASRHPLIFSSTKLNAAAGATAATAAPRREIELQNARAMCKRNYDMKSCLHQVRPR